MLHFNFNSHFISKLYRTYEKYRLMGGIQRHPNCRLGRRRLDLRPDATAWRSGIPVGMGWWVGHTNFTGVYTSHNLMSWYLSSQLLHHLFAPRWVSPSGTMLSISFCGRDCFLKGIPKFYCILVETSRAFHLQTAFVLPHVMSDSCFASRLWHGGCEAGLQQQHGA